MQNIPRPEKLPPSKTSTFLLPLFQYHISIAFTLAPLLPYFYCLSSTTTDITFLLSPCPTSTTTFLLFYLLHYHHTTNHIFIVFPLPQPLPHFYRLPYFSSTTTTSSTTTITTIILLSPFTTNTTTFLSFALYPYHFHHHCFSVIVPS